MCKVEALKKNVGVESVDITFEAEGLAVLYWEKLAAAVAAKLLQSCPTVRPHRWQQAPPSLGFSRQEFWSGLPFPPPMHESEK